MIDHVNFSGPMDRRHYLARFGLGLGALAASDMMARQAAADVARRPDSGQSSDSAPGVSSGRGGDRPDHGGLHHAPTARRVIFLFQSGGPSQLETWDHKPLLNQRRGEPLPDSVRGDQRLTGMSGNQSVLPLVGSIYGFSRHGRSGTWASELLPHTAGHVDRMCVVRSMVTEAINHDPAITFFQTGNQIAGRPSIGSWVRYGLGTENENLPAFVVLVTRGKGGQPLYSRLWGSGFLPSEYSGVPFRAGREPVLYLDNPPGITAPARREMLDGLRALHRARSERNGDPTLASRIAQYEMAFRLQSSIPEVNDLSDEPEHVFDLYGPDSKQPGTFAANCLLARRLAERGVKFIQLYHQGWDHHGGLVGGMKRQCRETDQPSAALLADLSRRGLLDDTLVIWGGEFGRTNYCQGRVTQTEYGRDHHPRCFSMWLAGGGVRGGHVHGETCEFGYNVARDPVPVRDLHATILHVLGIDHRKFTVPFQGLDAKLTGVKPARVVREILA